MKKCLLLIFQTGMRNIYIISALFKGAISGLRQFLSIERALKTMKNAFYFTLTSLFVLKVFKFLS